MILKVFSFTEQIFLNSFPLFLKHTNSDFVQQFGHENFDFFSTKGMIFGKLDDWSDTIKLSTIVIRLHDLNTIQNKLF